MTGLLADRVVLVSGGTQGVGAAAAREALAEGATVVVTGRRAEVGEAFVASLVDEFPAERVGFVQTDLADVAQARASVEAVVTRHGRIDGLVNAAGVTSRGTMLDTTPELLDQHLTVNLKAPFFTMQAAIEDMRRRGAEGAIVNVLTLSSHGGQPFLAPYVASKAGLAGLTKNAAHAHRFDRIRINGLNIGWTETEGEDAVQREFHGAQDGWLEEASAALPMGRLGQPHEIARMIVFLLSPASGIVTGSVIDWDQQVMGAYD